MMMSERPRRCGRGGLGSRVVSGVLAGFPVLAVLAVASLVACRAQVGAVYDQVFTCDLSQHATDCGTTKAGGAMTCFRADQLGGTPFCAEACDPEDGVKDPAGFVCTSSGALLKICHPNASKEHPHDQVLGCPSSLNCYRTNLLSDDGVCIMMPVCSRPSDCANTARPICASTVVQGLSSLPFPASNLQCLAGGCGKGSGCPAGEVCIGESYSFGPPLDEICVPACDSKFHCPPNFSCATTQVLEPGLAPPCLPGLPGRRCTDDRECLAGRCVDIGIESKICALPWACTKQSDCDLLNSTSDRFVCTGGPQRVCASLRVLHGINCMDSQNSADCPAAFGLKCLRYSPYMLAMSHGECRLPCDTNGRCPSRGGVPHVCLGANQEGGCFPGSNGMPCHDSSECIEGLSCETAPADPRSMSNYSSSICTASCGSDEDCDKNSQTPSAYCTCGPGVRDSVDGSCRDGVGVCRVGGWIGTPCERDAHCGSRNCSQVTGMCAPALTP